MVTTPERTFGEGRRIAVPTPSKRDTRLDVLRGLALITIFINHVPGQIFEHLTTKNYGFSDAAEAFVLISGIAVGIAYGARFKVGAWFETAKKSTKRAFTLYLAHMITTFMTLALFMTGAWLFHRPGLLCEINILAVLTNPHGGIPSLMLLGHQIGYNNILPMYGALMLMVPIILLLEARSPLLALTVSGAVWLVSGIYEIAPHNTLIEGYWFLNPLSWQFLFTIGIVGMMHVRRGGKLPQHPLLLVLAAAYVVMSFVWVVGQLWGIGNALASLGLPPVITGFDKTFLSLPRLLHVLSLAYLVLNIGALSTLLRRPETNPLVIFGRHSLNIFVAGTILAMIGQVLLYINNGDQVVGPIFVALGLAIQFVYAYHLERKRLQGRAASAARQPQLGSAQAIAVRADNGRGTNRK